MRPAGTLRFLQVALVLATLGFAWLRFSDNTVDNDLWGHVLYGQRYWNQGQVRETEQLSWTAAGFPVVNHEYLAEIVVGAVHRAAGGSGLFFYMIGMAAATVTLALSAAVRGSSIATSASEGTAGRESPAAVRWAAWLLFAASINFIALGFAVRPQLFTTLFIVVELILLREIAKSRLALAFFIPWLFAFWINFHGGVLAGLITLLVFAVVETAQALVSREGREANQRKSFAPFAPSRDPFPSRGRLAAELAATRPPRRNLPVYWILFLSASAALLLNPWGAALIKWNVDAIQLTRPQIHEWQPMSLTAAHAPFFVVALLSLAAWGFSRLPRKPWEAVALLMFAAMGVLHQRHAPLFGLANLIFSPRHLVSAAQRLAPHARDLVSAFARPAVQVALAVALLAGGGAALMAGLGAPKEHRFTMEVEKNIYPVAAVEFMRAHRLTGKTITFFDWGQQNLWELPDNPVSFDGRFDTGYPRAVIVAHWDFYAGKALRPEVPWDDAEVALLPAECPGLALLIAKGWRGVYLDPLAVVLVPAHGPHAGFMDGQRLQRRGDEAVTGRVPFPDALPVLATRTATR